MSQRVKRIISSGTHVLSNVKRLERVVVNSGAPAAVDLRFGTVSDEPFALIDASVEGSYPYEVEVKYEDDLEVVVSAVSVALSASSSSDDILIDAGHGLSNGDRIVFTSLTGGAGLSTGVTYFVVNATTGTFQVSETFGGAAVDFTTDISAANYEEAVDVTIVYE